MKPISASIVKKTWRKMEKISPDEARQFVNLMSREQPFILVYLMAIGGDTLNQDERELLLYLGIVIWQIMLQGDTPLPKITRETLDNVEKSNMKMLEYLEGESDVDFVETVEKIVANYPQPEILKYVLEALMEKPEGNSLIRDINKGAMFIYLKTVIDCFSK